MPKEAPRVASQLPEISLIATVLGRENLREPFPEAFVVVSRLALYTPSPAGETFPPCTISVVVLSNPTHLTTPAAPHRVEKSATPVGGVVGGGSGGVTTTVFCAEQLALVPPLDPEQLQLHGPLPVTEDAVPTEQRLVDGADDTMVPFAEPQTPEMGVGVLACVVPDTDAGNEVFPATSTARTSYE